MPLVLKMKKMLYMLLTFEVDFKQLQNQCETYVFL
jgi:hypothetical protein